MRFVIQRHTTADGVHWDLMLEHDGVLWTWRLDTAPSDITETAVAAERIFDHPLKFLTYEGPVQNNTGSVRIADQGDIHSFLAETTKITCTLEGQTLKGNFLLLQENSMHWVFQRDIEKK